MIFPPFIKAFGTVQSVRRRIHQAEVFRLFTETSPGISPIHLRTELRRGQQTAITLKQGCHQVGISVFQHRPIYQCHLVCRQRTRPSPSVVGCELRFTSHCRRIERKQPSVGLCRPLSECITSCHIAIQIIVACRMSRFSFRPHETALPELIPPSAARLFVLCRMQFLFRFLQSGFPIGHDRSLYRMQGDSERLSVGGFPAFICPCFILRSAVMPPACAAEYQITRNAASEYQISQRVI